LDFNKPNAGMLSLLWCIGPLIFFLTNCLNTVFLSTGPLVISIEKLCLWNATVSIGPLDMLLPLNTSVQYKLPSFRDFLSLLSSLFLLL
jgi:hypothetical protein